MFNPNYTNFWGLPCSLQICGPFPFPFFPVIKEKKEETENKVIRGGDGNDKLIGGVGNDMLYGGAGNDRLDGGAGRDELYGDEGDDVLRGGNGDGEKDVLVGGAGNDTIHLEAGDLARGGSGDDTYIVGQPTSGNTSASKVITIEAKSDGGDDRLEIAAKESDVSAVSRTGPFDSTLVIGLKNGASIHIKDYFHYQHWACVFPTLGSIVSPDLMGSLFLPIPRGGLEKIVFTGDEPGTEWTGEDVLERFGGGNLKLTGTEESDTLIGRRIGRNTIKGLAGDDRIEGGDWADTLEGGAGNDILDGGDSGDTLKGGDGNDILIGGAGYDSFNGGAGNDIIKDLDGREWATGGAGDDTYNISAEVLKLGFLEQFKQYASPVTITNADDGNGYDKLNTGVSLNLARDIWQDGSSLVIELYGYSSRAPLGVHDFGGARIIITDYFVSDSAGKINEKTAIDEINFGGQILSQAEITEWVKIKKADRTRAEFVANGWGSVLSGDDRDNLLRGRTGGDRLIGEGGDDVLRGEEGSDWLDGGQGNDTLRGGTGNDILLGGLGDDNLHGGAGGDLYEYEKGDGFDTLYDLGSDQSAIDRLTFGVEFSGISLVKSGQDLLISVKDSPNEGVRVLDWYKSTDHQIEQLRFFGRTVLNTEVDQLIADMAAFGGSKTLSTTSAATDPNRVDQETITVPGA